MMNIQQACEAFRILLEEQQARIANMNGEKTDFTKKEVVTIGVIDGDGIGPIITQAATKVLEKLLAEEVAAGSIVIKYIQGLTIENRIACGQPIPSDVLAQIKTCDVILKGPTETPHGGTLESANVAMRRELERGGQVYYMHNRTQSIDRCAARLQTMLAVMETLEQGRKAAGIFFPGD